MIKFINKLSGGPMWVHESRVEEYLAAGHVLAAPPKAAKPLIKDNEEKTTTKRRTRAK